MDSKKYISKSDKEYEIVFKAKKNIPDIESYLYRFQIYIDDLAFSCDFTISDYKMKKFSLKESDAINICFDLIYKVLDEDIEEYCSIRIGEKNIVEYMMT